jgi:hypothetical protein
VLIARLSERYVSIDYIPGRGKRDRDARAGLCFLCGRGEDEQADLHDDLAGGKRMRRHEDLLQPTN